VIVDWLPWNHTFGGNHDVGIALYNGVPFISTTAGQAPVRWRGRFATCAKSPRPCISNVPKGYEDLLPVLRADRELRENFFSRLGLMFYCRCGSVAARMGCYRELAFETCGERIIMATGLGSTETSPMAMQTTWETDRAGTIGIPVPGSN